MPAKKSSSRKTSARKPAGKTAKKPSAAKSAAPGKSRKPKKPARKPSGLWARLRRLLLLLVSLGLAALLFYGIYLSQLVTIKFEGKRWAVPARVYAKPLELYPGAAISPARLRAEIKRLGYREQQQPGAPGTWKSTADGFELHTRPFVFWDESVPSLSLKISFENGQVASIRNLQSAQQETLLRLEAPMIDSIYPSHNEDRILVRYQDLPQMLVATLIAVEDRDFDSHHGISIRSIARAALANLRAGRVVQGGSTLTQQLVKNFFLSSERTLLRKFNEALMAIIIDARYSKQAILETYANEIYLGQDGRRAIHGFGLASRYYFNRPLQELDLPRIALLVGMIKGPSWFDPRRHPQRARERRDLVLDLLLQQELISAEQHRRASARPLGIVEPSAGGQRGYPAFIKLVRQQLQRDYQEADLTSEGLRIFTTLDPWIQQQAILNARSELESIEKQRKLPAGKLQMAIVIANSNDGEVLAMVGARHQTSSGFNRAMDAVRPIGSLVKPFVYLAALMQPQRFSLLTPLEDRAISLPLANGKKWQPENYDGKEHGEVPLINALAHSYNLATVGLGNELGLERVIDVLQKAGLKRQVNAFPSLLLGAVSLSPLEVTQLYQTLAGGGFQAPLRAIREVLNADNQPLQRYPLTLSQTLPAAPVYLTNIALQRVVSLGTGRGLQRFFPVEHGLAGKTGTTNDLRDSWFAGFSGDYVASVWLGRDDNSEAGLSGASGSLPVWGRVMSAIDARPLKLRSPADIEWLLIDQQNGLLASEQCENTVRVPFISGYGPDSESPCVDNNRGFFDRLFNGTLLK